MKRLLWSLAAIAGLVLMAGSDWLAAWIGGLFLFVIALSQALEAGPGKDECPHS